MLAACEGQAPEPRVASLKAASPTPAAASDAGFQAFKDCMRARGYPLDDIESEKINTDDAGFQSAQQACSSLYKQAPNGSQLDPRIVDRLLRYAQCTRAHGVPMTDPVVTESSAEVTITDPRYGPDSPEYLAANAECAKYMHSNSPGDGG
jgi:hypothetical protein